MEDSKSLKAYRNLTPEDDPEFVQAFRTPRRAAPTNLPPITAEERASLKELADHMRSTRSDRYQDLTWDPKSTPEHDPEFIQAFRSPRITAPTNLAPLTEGERAALKELAKRMRQ